MQTKKQPTVNGWNTADNRVCAELLEMLAQNFVDGVLVQRTTAGTSAPLERDSAMHLALKRAIKLLKRG